MDYMHTYTNKLDAIAAIEFSIEASGAAEAIEYDIDAIADEAIEQNETADRFWLIEDHDTFWDIVFKHAYEVVEDSAGYIHVSNGREAWALGYDHTEDDARIAADIAAWRAGEWQPSEADGQKRLTLVEFRDIADMTDSTRRSPITGAREE